MPDPIPQPPSTDPIAVVLPVHNAADRLPALVAEWDGILRDLGREYTILAVNDGSTDGTGAVLARLANDCPVLRVLTHEKRKGFGACLRAALPEVTAPVVAYVLTDYPYTPSDLRKLLDRLDQPCDVYGVEKLPDAVGGCRTGRPVPPVWRGLGWAYRTFCRLFLGSPIEPLPGWLGLRDHVRSWTVWLTMGVPLADVNGGLKVFRRSVFDRFPIQSAGDFAHAEVFAKLTFIGSLVAEEPLTPSPEPVPATDWSDFWRVFQSPAFHHPHPDLSRPPEPAPADPPPA